MPNQKKKKILWLVDPFATDSKLQRAAAFAIRALMQGQSYEVEPVYLLGGYIVDVSLELPLDYAEQTRTSAQKGLDSLLNRYSFPELRPLIVFSQPYLPLRKGMIDLISHARETAVDLITIGTRARKGIGRWIMGSFAETMIFLSDIPLLVVNPHWNRISHYKHILFPTDFSEESRTAFLEVLALAKALKSHVTLFHKMEYGLVPAIEMSLNAYTAYEGAFKKSIDKRHIEAWQWRDQAKILGVQTHVFIDYLLQGGIAEAILAFAKKKPGLIAMAAHSGAIKSVLLGSVARKVVRASPDPVWIWHPQKQPAAEVSAAKPSEAA